MPSVGWLGAALLPGVPQEKSRACPTVLCQTPRGLVGMASPPPVPGAASGAGRCSGRAAAQADWWARARCRGRLGHHHGWGPSWGRHVPAAVSLRVCASSCARQRARVGRGSWHGHGVHGLGVGRWSRVLCPGRVGVSAPAGGRPMGSGGGGRGRRPCRAPAAPGPHRGAARGQAVGRRTVRPPSLPGPDAVAVPLSHVPRGLVVSCGAGGPRVGGGRRSSGGPGPGVGLQPPNKGLQATGNSLRSCLAPALSRA